MNVLFVSPAPAIFGSERSMLTLLGARKFHAEVVCPLGGELERELGSLGLRVHGLDFASKSFRENPVWHAAFYARFLRILERAKPDVVVINLDGHSPVVTMAACQSRVPIVRLCRFEFSPPVRSIDRWSWRKAKAVVCPSETVRSQYLSWVGVEREAQVHRIYDPLYQGPSTRASGDAFQQQFGLKERIVIGCVTRLHRGKRIETAIEAAAAIRKKIENIHLLIIGADDGSPDGTAYRESLARLAETMGIGDAVTFTGYLSRDRIPAAYKAMKAVVVPSESESFGLVLVEAWAHGVPTVASDIGGCGEISRASGGGLLAPVGDSDLFARGVLRILTAPDDGDSMRRHGAQWVSENCSPLAYAERFGAVLDAAVKEKE